MKKSHNEIVGVGIDLVDVERIEKAVSTRKAFLKRLYAEEEIRLSNKGKFRFEELAGRFAVKEAVLKVLKTGWRQGVKFNEIIVLNERSGAPYVRLTGRAREVADDLGIKNIYISISHTKTLAVGLAVATR
ncbi:MAG TPA: holo-[acyl-carrier-protein] synthase [candidate division WOR-3 bacterium]|uniref:Holo-[acyl-carrier-protein] synthase n=1 Tax=candidate division WOR-3 bacterium TaxID=2052148 RepID=A0A9C9ENT3_UNCW3|nr:holo-[acyl-carrier-protein] synthase [candidate division WOR-3 bacterium]